MVTAIIMQRDSCLLQHRWTMDQFIIDWDYTMMTPENFEVNPRFDVFGKY